MIEEITVLARESAGPEDRRAVISMFDRSLNAGESKWACSERRG